MNDQVKGMSRDLSAGRHVTVRTQRREDQRRKNSYLKIPSIVTKRNAQASDAWMDGGP
jgi:hypothetical protein